MRSELRPGQELKAWTLATNEGKPLYPRWVTWGALPLAVAVTFFWNSPIPALAALLGVNVPAVVTAFRRFESYVLAVTDSGLLLVRMAAKFLSIDPSRKISKRFIPFAEVSYCVLDFPETALGKEIVIHLMGGEAILLKLVRDAKALADPDARMRQVLELLKAERSTGAAN